MLNGGNARNFRLAFRRDDGAPVPFLLLGTDGGLLEQAQPCTEVFLSPAERIDVLVDFAGIPVGGYVLLESRAFDPMQALPARAAEPGGTRYERSPRHACADGAGVRIAPHSGWRSAPIAAVPHSRTGCFVVTATGPAFRGTDAASRRRRTTPAPWLRERPLANQ